MLFQRISNKKTILFRSRPLPAACSDWPRLSKSILFQRILNKKRYFFGPGHSRRGFGPDGLRNHSFLSLSFSLSPFCEGWRPVLHGTPTLAQSPLSCYFLFLVLGYSVRVGVPFSYGTPTLTEWPVLFFFLFLVFGHSVRVGVPFFTGRQPSQNGRCHFLYPVSGVVPFCEGGRPVFYGPPTLT